MLVCPTTNCSRAVEQGRKSSDTYDFSRGSSHRIKMRIYILQMGERSETITFPSFGKMAYACREWIISHPSDMVESVNVYNNGRDIAKLVKVYNNERNIAEFLSQLKVSQLGKVRVQLTYLVRVSKGDPPSKVYSRQWMHGEEYYRKLKDQQIMVVAIHRIERQVKVFTKDNIVSYFLRKQHPHADCRECPSCCVVVMENDSCTLCKKYRKVLVWGGHPYNQIQQPIDCVTAPMTKVTGLAGKRS